MNTLKSAREEALNPGGKRKRSPSYLVASFALHVLIFALLVRFLISPNMIWLMLGGGRSAPVPTERIGFLRLPKAKGTPVIGKSGGDNRPVTKTAPVKLVAPTAVPSTLPPVAPSTQPASPEAGSGPLVGTGGPARGIKPSYDDPRLWPAPGDIVSAPKTPTQRLDSVIADIIKPYNDSMAIVNGQRKPGDWTFDHDGKKYGMDFWHHDVGVGGEVSFHKVNQAFLSGQLSAEEASVKQHAAALESGQRWIDENPDLKPPASQWS